MKKSKREVATLIPFYTTMGEVYFFLQKRDAGAPTHAGYFGFFGGGIENQETHDQAIIREMQEEFRFTPLTHTLFSRYETYSSINYVYILQAEENFGSTVSVYEGECGMFLTLAQVAEYECQSIVLSRDLLVLKELSQYLSQATVS